MTDRQMEKELDSLWNFLHGQELRERVLATVQDLPLFRQLDEHNAEMFCGAFRISLEDDMIRAYEGDQEVTPLVLDAYGNGLEDRVRVQYNANIGSLKRHQIGIIEQVASEWIATQNFGTTQEELLGNNWTENAIGRHARSNAFHGYAYEESRRIFRVYTTATDEAARFITRNSHIEELRTEVFNNDYRLEVASVLRLVAKYGVQPTILEQYNALWRSRDAIQRSPASHKEALKVWMRHRVDAETARMHAIRHSQPLHEHPVLPAIQNPGEITSYVKRVTGLRGNDWAEFLNRDDLGNLDYLQEGEYLKSLIIRNRIRPAKSVVSKASDVLASKTLRRVPDREENRHNALEVFGHPIELLLKESSEIKVGQRPLLEDFKIVTEMLSAHFDEGLPVRHRETFKSYVKAANRFLRNRDQAVAAEAEAEVLGADDGHVRCWGSLIGDFALDEYEFRPVTNEVVSASLGRVLRLHINNPSLRQKCYSGLVRVFEVRKDDRLHAAIIIEMTDSRRGLWRHAGAHAQSGTKASSKVDSVGRCIAVAYGRLYQEKQEGQYAYTHHCGHMPFTIIDEELCKTCILTAAECECDPKKYTSEVLSCMGLRDKSE